MTNKYKIILAIAFILSLLIGARYSYGQTTTVTVNGNTTTTTTITNTPISTVNTPNTPNIGDITNTTTNQTTTDIMTKVANTNSGNLVPTNFCDNSWTGTQKTANPSGQTSDLGCNYITGKNTTTYLENSVNLSNKGITKQEQNLGLTQSASAHTHHFWGWNSYLNFSHSITNNDTGATITQNREWNHNNSISGSTKSLDNIIIGENSASGYTSKIRFDSSSSGGGATWQGVDINNPNLSITYNKLTSTSSSLQTVSTTIIPCESLGTCYVPPAIIPPKLEVITEEEIKQIFKEEFAKVGLSETDIGMSNLDYKEMAKEINTQAVTDMKESNPTVFESPEPKTTTTTEEPKASTIAKEEPKETITSTKESNAATSSDKETTTVSEKTNTNTDTKSEESKTTTSQSATNENQKAEGSQTEKANEKNVADTKTTTNEKGANINVGVEVKIKAAIEKVEKELKSIEDKTKAIQEIKLEGLKSGAPNLSVYENKQFYDVRQMVGVPNPDFFNQINIEQQQIYKDASLSAYTRKDPIAVKQALQLEIEEEMNKLILEIELLRKG